MPTYDYKCSACEYRFEVFQGINEQPLRQCPRCNGMVQRIIGSGSGLIFKGSGFYITDYKKNKPGRETVKKEKN